MTPQQIAQAVADGIDKHDPNRASSPFSLLNKSITAEIVKLIEAERVPVTMNLFKPEDFYLKGIGQDGGICYNTAAEIANEKLNALIESWPMVYTRIILDGPMTGSCEQLKMPHHTHQTRLAFITPIEREPCVHEPADKFVGPNTQDWKVVCKHCNIELVPTWKAKE